MGPLITALLIWGVVGSPPSLAQELPEPTQNEAEGPPDRPDPDVQDPDPASEVLPPSEAPAPSEPSPDAPPADFPDGSAGELSNAPEDSVVGEDPHPATEDAAQPPSAEEANNVAPEPAPEQAPAVQAPPRLEPAPGPHPQPAPSTTGHDAGSAPPATLEPSSLGEPEQDHGVAPVPDGTDATPTPLEPVGTEVSTDTPGVADDSSEIAAPESLLDRWLPALSERGLRPFGRRLLLAGLALLAAAGARRVTGTLGRDGLLPNVLGSLQVIFRVLALLLALGALVALLPAELLPMVTWVLMAAALAVGWSGRELMADVISGLALRLEQPLRPGDWIEGSEFSGTVEHVGLRAVILHGADGERTVVPFGRLAQRGFTAGPRGGPVVSAAVTLDPALSPSLVRSAARLVLVSSPWVDSAAPISVGQDPAQQGHWTVRVHLLEPSLEGSHLGTLHERLAQEIKAATAPSVQPDQADPPDEAVSPNNGDES